MAKRGKEDALLASCLLIERFRGGSWSSHGGCDVELVVSGGRSALRKSVSSSWVMEPDAVSISSWRSLASAGVSADSMMAEACCRSVAPGARSEVGAVASGGAATASRRPRLNWTWRL
jgi:hypothetical protein